MQDYRDSRHSDVEEKLLAEDNEDDGTALDLRPRRRVTRTAFCVTVFNSLMLFASAILFSASMRSKLTLNADLKKVSAYSPVLETGSIPLIDRQVSGKLFPAKDGTDKVGRAEPGPETDELWRDFEHPRMFAVSSSEVRRMGKDPVTTIKFPPEYGLGDDAYMATLDVFHQIHCLNQIRIEAFKDYYFDGEKFHEELYGPSSQPKRMHNEFHWIHLRHCMDMLLQTLMCHSDTEMITMTWMETQENPWPDFSVNKKCKSFDAVREWRDKHAQPQEKTSALRKPYDLVRVDDQYWQLFGNSTTEGDNTHHPW